MVFVSILPPAARKEVGGTPYSQHMLLPPTAEGVGGDQSCVVGFDSVTINCCVRMLSIVIYAKELVEFIREKVKLFLTRSEKGPSDDTTNGSRVCVVRPRVSSLFRVSTSSSSDDDNYDNDDGSQESSWRFYGAVLLNEEGALFDEEDSDSEDEEGGVGFVWNFHSGGGWNGWNQFD